MMTLKTLLLVLISLTVLVLAHSERLRKKHVACLNKILLPSFVRQCKLSAKQVRRLFCRNRQRSPDPGSPRKQSDMISLAELTIAQSKQLKKRNVVCLPKEQLPGIMINQTLPDKRVRQIYCSKRKRSRTRGSPRSTRGSPRSTGGSPRSTGGSPRSTGGSPLCTGGITLRTGGITLRTGGTPRRTGGSPRSTGGSPRSTGGSPRSTGGSPRSTGGTPRNTGGSPRRTGGSPRSTGGSPRSTGGSPRSTGGSPRRTGRTPRKQNQNTVDYCTTACVSQMRLPLAVNGSEKCITLEANIKYSPLRAQIHMWLVNGTPLPLVHYRITKSASAGGNPLNLTEVVTRRADVEVEPKPGIYMLRITSFKKGTDTVEHYRECCVAGLGVVCRQNQICRDNMTEFPDNCRGRLQ